MLYGLFVLFSAPSAPVPASKKRAAPQKPTVPVEKSDDPDYEWIPDHVQKHISQENLSKRK
jgi:hypothetical protein